MNEYYLKQVENLNNKDVTKRLNSLAELKKGIDSGIIQKPLQGNDVNNHIHTSYSFSPYSPTKALWMAYINGLKTAGIMDHDTLAGAKEFVEAGKIIGMATTVGLELRVSMENTILNDRRINNPDQNTIVYMAMHGVPHTQIEKVQKYIKAYGEHRNTRNAKMVDKLNSVLAPFNIAIDFEKEVKPLSLWNEGGSITERHISFALAYKLVASFGKGEKLVDFYKNTMNLPLSKKLEELLLDESNPVYEYDLLGAIKSNMIDKFYMDAIDECPSVEEAVSFCNEVGAISAYAYLGDVKESVTGDKKAQKFEDDYIEDVFKVLSEVGFNAVTYMPSRNTREQILKIKEFCDRYEFFQISGEDINSPRQQFVCFAMRDELFSNLIDSTWALIGHEIEATKDIELGFIKKYKNMPLYDKINIYKKIGGMNNG